MAAEVLLLLALVLLSLAESTPCEAKQQHAKLRVLDAQAENSRANHKGQGSNQLKWSSKSIQYVTEDARGDITLQDLRTQLEGGDSSYAAFLAFATLDPNATCVTPLSRFQESFTMLDEGIVVLGGTEDGDMDDALAAYLHPPSQVVLWNMVRPKPLGNMKDAASFYCSDWLKQVHLLSGLWEKRTLYKQDWKKEMQFELRQVEALEYFGFSTVRSLKDGFFPVIATWEAWKKNNGLNDPLVGNHMLNRMPSDLVGDKVNLFYRTKDLSKRCDAFDLFSIMPETYHIDDEEDCEKIKEVVNDRSWLRKDGARDFGFGIEVVDKLKEGDCEFDDPSRASTSVLYQRKIDTLKINGRITMFRLYALVASFDPLVIFSNFNQGHFTVAPPSEGQRGGDWYAQNGTGLFSKDDVWTYEKLDDYMAKERGIPNFFLKHIYPQFKEILGWSIAAVKDDFAGGTGHYDLICQDIVMSSDFKLHLLEMNSDCDTTGFDEGTFQRSFIWNNAMETVMNVQNAVLSDNSVLNLVDETRWTPNGFFELVYSNQPGASFEQEHVSMCDKEETSGNVEANTQGSQSKMEGTGIQTFFQSFFRQKSNDSGSNKLQEKLQFLDTAAFTQYTVENKDEASSLKPCLKERVIQYSISEGSSSGGRNGTIALRDLRAHLKLSPGTSFAKLGENATCVTPLSRFQESFTMLDEGIVVLGGTEDGDMDDALAAYLHPPSQVVLWNMVRPKPLGNMKDAASFYCSDWLKQVHLLSGLWERRKYYLKSSEKNYRFESRIVEALSYFGWAETGEMEESLVPLTHEWETWDSEKMSQGSKGLIGNYLVSRPPPILTSRKSLIKHLIASAAGCGDDCMSAFDIFPETFYAGNYMQCKALKEYIDTPGSKWMRTSSTYKKGMGPIRKLTSGDCSPDGDSEVSYQRIIDTLKVDGRATSFKLYALFASFDPLVVFSNFQNGHVSILGDEDLSKWDGSCPYCRSASASSDLWSFSKLDKYMAKEHNIENFFATHVFPQYTNILSWIIQSLKSKFAGGVGHFDLVCMDFVLSEDDNKLYLLDVNSNCDALGKEDPVKQRKHIWVSAMEVVLEIQKSLLSDNSVLHSLDDQFRTANGFYQLSYSNQPGAEHTERNSGDVQNLVSSSDDKPDTIVNEEL